MTTPFGKLRRDESSHWYCVPLKLLEKYDALVEAMEAMDMCEAGTSPECGEFEALFSQYRIDSPEDIICVLPND